MLDLDMSPYGAFVWPAWVVSVLVLGGLVTRAVAASRRWRAELKRLEGERGPDRDGVS
jgi:heme exporter protein D